MGIDRNELRGWRELESTLKSLGESKVKKATITAVGKALRVMAKAMKQQVPPKFRGIKKAIGSRFAKSKGGASKGIVQAKAGIGVGIRRVNKRKGQWVRNKKFNSGKHGSGGVGISAANAHWFILGTGQRETGSVARKNKTGPYRKPTGNKVRRTGRMPAQVPEIIKKGYAASEPAATAALINGLKDWIAKEASRK